MIDLDMLLCGLLVAVFSLNRFNSLQDREFPPPSRSTTTAIRYHMAQALYVLFSVALLVAFAVSPQLLRLFQFDPSKMPEQVKNLPSSYVAALLLTSLLPNVPLLGRVDGWIRERLYAAALIPSEARRLKRQLMGVRFIVPDSLLGPVSTELGSLAPRLLGDRGDECRSHLSKCASVLQGLNAGSGQRWFAAVHGRFDADLRALETRFRELRDAAVDHFEVHVVAEPGARANKRFYEELVVRSRALFEDLCRLVARASLQTHASDRRRAEFLRRLGFEVSLPGSRTTTAIVNRACQAFVVVALAMLVVFVGLSAGERGSRQFLPIVLKSTMIACVYGAAVAWVMVLIPGPKGGTAGERRWGRYIMVVLGAVCADLVIRFFFKSLAALNSTDGITPAQAAWNDLMDKLPWSVLTVVVSGVCAYLADSPIVDHAAEARRRWMDGLVLSGCSAAASVVVWKLLMDPPPLPAIMVTMAFIGFTLGFCVPGTCRRAGRAQDGDGATGPAGIACAMDVL